MFLVQLVLIKLRLRHNMREIHIYTAMSNNST